MGERRGEKYTVEGSGGERSWEENTRRFCHKVGGRKTGEQVRSLGESWRDWGTFGQCVGIAGMVGVWGGAGLWEVKDPREGALHFVSLGWYGLGGKVWEDTRTSQALPPWGSNGKELLRSGACIPHSS